MKSTILRGCEQFRACFNMAGKLLIVIVNVIRYEASRGNIFENRHTILSPRSFLIKANGS